MTGREVAERVACHKGSSELVSSPKEGCKGGSCCNPRVSPERDAGMSDVMNPLAAQRRLIIEKDMEAGVDPVDVRRGGARRGVRPACVTCRRVYMNMEACVSPQGRDGRRVV